MFGSELLVMPITNKTSKTTSLAPVEGFLPNGTWYDIFTDKIYQGGIESTFYRDINSIPVFAKQGAIIPLFVDKTSNNIETNQDLEILIYSGNNEFELYEDDGESKEYLNGNYSIRKIIVNKIDNKITLKISASNNPLYTQEINRNIKLIFKDIVGGDLIVNKNYNLIKAKCLTIEINDKNDETVIEITNIKYLHNENKIEAITSLVSSYQLLNDVKNEMFLYYYDSNTYKQYNLPKHLKGPIEEIIKLKY